MPIVTVNPGGLRVDAPAGTVLLRALVEAGVPIGHNCPGSAQCGTCHLFVQEGRKSLNRATRPENEKLDTIPGVGSKSRLACQAILGEEDITVELLSFESGL